MRLRTVLATVLASSLFVIGNARADITNGIVAYLKLNETSGLAATDSSGSGNNGTLVNFPGDGSERALAGRMDGALICNTTGPINQYVSLADNPSVNFNTGLMFTIAGWVNSSVAGTAQASGAGVFCKGTGNGGEQFTVDFNTGRFRFYVRNSASTVTQMTSPLAVNSNTWYHVAAVFNASGTNRIMQLYVNGQMVVSATAPTSLRVNNHVVSIGNRESSASSGYNLPFKGMIDDVRIYNRGLSATDVQELYLSATGIAPILTSEPLSLTRFVGDTAIFSATVDGNSTIPLSYQWQKDTVAIPNATNATLVLTNLQLSDIGNYSIRVTNSAGSVVSSNAFLQVNSLPAPDTVNNLLALWAFDETTGSIAADSVLNVNPGTLNNFPFDDSQWVAGRVANGLRFNADFSGLTFVTIPDPGIFDFSSNPAFTLSAWVKGPAIQTNGGAIMAKGTGAGGEQFALDMQVNTYRFYVRDQSGAVVNVVAPMSPNNLWQHIVVVFDAANRVMNMYINGQLVAAGVPPASLLSNTHEVSIGSRQSSAISTYNLPFTGTIDDVHVYGRALNSGDVKALYFAAGIQSPTVIGQPQGSIRYVGDNVTFTTTVDGTYPLGYQWMKGGSPLAGATGSSLTLTNLQVSDAGVYSVQITNMVGITTSSNAVLQVSVFSITNTVAYWKFNETSGLTATDSSGNNNTANLQLFPGDDSQWVSGRVNGALNFNADGTAQTVVTAPDSASLNFTNTPAFTLAAWVKGPASQISGAGIVAKGGGAGGEQYALDVFSGVYRLYVRNAGGTSINAQSAVGPNSRWQHVVAVFDGVAGVMQLYVNGQLVASNTPPTSLFPSTHEVSIGSRQSATVGPYNFAFKGAIDDVRIYSRALTPTNVQELFTAAGPMAPIFYTQPQGATRFVGDNITLSGLVDGTEPISYQWKRNGINIPGATNLSLALNNLQFNDAGTYVLQASNIASVTVSANAVVQVLTLPAPDLTTSLIAHWAFDETTGTAALDSSGGANHCSLLNFPGDDSQWVPGRIGGAIRLNSGGANNHLVGTDNPITPQNGDQFTFSFWANRDGGATGVNPRIICPIGTQHWVVWSPGRGVGFYQPAVSPEPETNAWHHFVVVYDRAAGLYSLYVDGVRKVANAAGYSRPDPSSQYWIIGHSENVSSTTDSWNGLLDDLRMYNRLLNYNDIQALYLLGASPQLSITYNGSNITISWPRAASGFHLQSTTALAGGSTVWTDVATSPVISADGATQTVTLSSGSGTQFYRLQNP